MFFGKLRPTNVFNILYVFIQVLCHVKIREVPCQSYNRCNCTYKAQSQAMKRKAKLNNKPKTHTRGSKQAETTLGEGRARTRTGVRPEARIAMHAPDRHRDALPRHRATLKLPERPRDESGPREARTTCLHRLVSQVAEQRQGRGPKAPNGLDRHRHEGQGGGYLPIRAPQSCYIFMHLKRMDLIWYNKEKEPIGNQRLHGAQRSCSARTRRGSGSLSQAATNINTT
jgi:hypothetical protein